MNRYRYMQEENGGDAPPAGAAPPATPPPATANWRDGLSADYKDNASLKDFSDINAFAKAHIDTKAMVGKMVRIPGEDASAADVQTFRDKLLTSNLGVIPTPDLTNPEEAAAYYLKMGTPEAADGYTAVEGMTPDRFEALSKMAHEAGISDKQFQQVAAGMVAGDTSVSDANAATQLESMNALKSEWGEAYDQKFARAQRLAEATKAPPMLLTALKEGHIDAATMRWLDGVAGSIGGEGNNLKDVGVVTADSRDELEHQRDELTRRLQTDERMPTAERSRLIAKNVDLNTRILALVG
jgi:hypothetical protein